MRIRPRDPAGREHPDAKIPDSSMADVAFLLLVFFLVTAVFSSGRGVPLAVAAEEEAGAAEADPVVIEVSADQVRVDCRPVPVERVAAQATARLREKSGAGLVLYATPEASYGDLVAVYDGLVAVSGTDRLSIATGTEIRAYEEAFGVHPFAGHCDERAVRP